MNKFLFVAKDMKHIFVTLDKFIEPIMKENPDLTEGQQGLLHGLFLGYAIAHDQTELSLTVCNKLIDSYNMLHEMAQKEVK